MAIWVYVIFGTNSGIFWNTLYPSLLKDLVHLINYLVELIPQFYETKTH